jgi:hypothetical protein
MRYWRCKRLVKGTDKVLLHKVYKSLDKVVLRMVRQLIKDGVWKTDKLECLSLQNRLVRDLADHYNIPSPLVKYGRTSFYNPDTGTITVTKCSLITLLHYFRIHQYFHLGGNLPLDSPVCNPQLDAAGFACSYLYNASPEDFMEAWQAGRVYLMPDYYKVKEDTAPMKGQSDRVSI